MTRPLGQTAIARSQITGADAYWLLDLELGGEIYRSSVDSIEVESGTETLAYREGLGSVSFSMSQEVPSISLQLFDTENWAKKVAQGLDLASGRATLRRIYAGQTFAQSRVLVSGRVIDPSYGGLSDPLEFGIQSVYMDSQPFPDPTQVVDARTWPRNVSIYSEEFYAPDPNVFGSVYPQIFGRPGYGISDLRWWDTRVSCPASPAYIGQYGKSMTAYQFSILIVAGHRLTATHVRVIDVSGGYNDALPEEDPTISETLPILYIDDRLGTSIAYVDISGATKIQLIPGNEYWIDWGHDSAYGGGLTKINSTELMRGMGDIIHYLLDKANINVAVGRMESAKLHLNAFKLDFAITDSIEVEAWIDTNITSVFGVARRESTGGVWYEMIPYDASRNEVEMVLVADTATLDRYGVSVGGAVVSRSSVVVYSPVEDVCNEITLEYAPQNGNKYTRRLTLTGQETPTEESQYPSKLCKLSRSRYGKRVLSLQCPVIADDSSALLALNHMAKRYCLPKRTISYEGGLELEALDYNSVVTITDSELFLDEALAIVKEIELTLTGVTLQLELIDTPDTTGPRSTS